MYFKKSPEFGVATLTSKISSILVNEEGGVYPVPDTAANIMILTESVPIGPEKSIVVVFSVVASQRTSMTSYGELTFLHTTTVSLVFKL